LDAGYWMLDAGCSKVNSVDRDKTSRFK